MSVEHDVQERLASMSDEEWTALVRDLTAFVASRVGRLRWRRGQRALPKGWEVADFVLEGVGKLLTGGLGWNPSTQPSLKKFLMNWIQGAINHLVESEEHRRLHRSSEEEDNPFSEVPDPSSLPDETLVLGEEDARVRALVEKVVAGDEDLSLVAMAILDYGLKPAAIAAQLGRPVKDIYRLIQKLRRRFEPLRTSLQGPD